MKENDGEGRGWIDFTCVAVLHAVTPCDLIWEKRRQDDHMTPIYSSWYSRLSVRQPERGAAAFKTSSIFLQNTADTSPHTCIIVEPLNHVSTHTHTHTHKPSLTPPYEPFLHYRQHQSSLNFIPLAEGITNGQWRWHPGVSDESHVHLVSHFKLYSRLVGKCWLLTIYTKRAVKSQVLQLSHGWKKLIG